MDTTVNEYKKSMNNKAQHAVDNVKQAGENFLDSNVGHQIVDTMKEYKERSTELYETSLEKVRANPLTAISIALGVGVIAGLALRGRRH